MFAFLGCNVSCDFIGSRVVGSAGMAMQLHKSGSSDAANKLQIQCQQRCGLDVIGKWAEA